MTNGDREEIKEAVCEAVKEALPVQLAELMSQEAEHNAKVFFLSHYKRPAVIAYLLLAIAAGLNFYNVGKQADENTRSNHQQDCVLVGLVRGVSQGDHDATRQFLYKAVIDTLEDNGACPELTAPPSATKGGRP